MSRTILSLLSLLLCLVAVAYAGDSDEPCAIYVPQNKVNDVVNEHLQPHAKEYHDCITAQNKIETQLKKKQNKKDGLNKEIELVKQLIKKVENKVDQKHEEREKSLNTLKSLLEKLTKALDTVTQDVKNIKSELQKQKAKCQDINKYRTKYLNALDTIKAGEKSMKRADKVIPKLEDKRDNAKQKVENIKDIIASHKKTIANKKDKKQEAKKRKDKCTSAHAEHKEFTQLLEDCKEELNPIKTFYNKCSKKKDETTTDNKQLKSQITSLEKKVQKLQGKNSKWKNLAEKYKPTVEDEEDEEDEQPEEEEEEEEEQTRYKGPRHMCRSTGDPHYLALNADNRKRAHYNVYNKEGDYLLFESPDREVEIHTRLGYSRRWRHRSVNRAIAIRSEGHTIEAYGGKDFRIDGKRETIAVGNDKTLEGGVIIKVSQRNKNIVSYTVDTPTGVIITFSTVRMYEDNTWYVNIAVHVPAEWSKTGRGLCMFPVRSNKKILQLRTDNKAGHHLFGTVYVPDNEDHPETKIEWKNQKLKEEAEKLCFNTLQKRGEFFQDCIMDAKIAGTTAIIEGFAEQQRNIDKLMQMEDDQENAPVGRAYHICSRILRAMSVQRNQLKKHNIVAELKKKQFPAVSKVEKVIKRLDTEIGGLRSINAELAKRFLK